MKPTPCIRKTMIWCGVVATALLLTIWAASERWCVTRETTNWTFSLNHGSVYIIPAIIGSFALLVVAIDAVKMLAGSSAEDPS